MQILRPEFSRCIQGPWHIMGKSEPGYMCVLPSQQQQRNRHIDMNACVKSVCMRNRFHLCSVLLLVDTKKLCAFIISFLLLKFSLILCSLIETSCFWRIKHKEVDDGDLRTDCVLILFMTPEPIEEDFYSTLIKFR